MAVDRIDSIFDVAAIAAEQEAVEKLVRASIEQIKAARSQSIDFNVNTKDFADYNKKIKELEKNLNGLQSANNEAVKASTLLAKQKQAEAKATEATAKATTAEEKAKQASVKTGKDVAKSNQLNAHQTREIQNEYLQLNKAYRDAALAAKGYVVSLGEQHPVTIQAQKDALAMLEVLNKAENSVGQFARQANNSRAKFDGLGNSINQLTREFPAFTNSVQTGFLALSNNFPIFFDQITSTKREIAALRAEGQKTPGLFRRLTSSILSWGTALSVGVTLLTVYGKEIGNFFVSLFQGKEAMDAFARRQKNLSEVMKESKSSFVDAYSNVKLLRTEIQAAKDGFLAKEDVVKHYNETIGKTTGAVKNLDEAEKELNANAENYIKFMLLKATANIALGKAAEAAFDAQQKFLDEKSGISARLNEDANAVEAAAKKNAKALGKSLDEQIKTGNEARARFLKSVISREEIAQKRSFENIFDEFMKQATAMSKEFDFNFFDPDKDKKKAKDTAEANRKAQFDILKNSIDLDLEFQKAILDNEKLSYEERLRALIAYTNRSQQLIDVTAQFELGAADLTAKERLKIESDKNTALIRLARETGAELQKILQRDLKVNTATAADIIKGIPAELQKIQDDFKKAQNAAIKEHEAALKKLKEDTKKALVSLASELQGLFFDIFTNQIEQQKNAVQDQIDLLEQQKQKDIEVANQTITNAQDKADAIAVIEARAAGKRQQLELKQRQLDQQKARFEKARTIAEIIQSTSLAVVNALTQVKTLGPGAIALAAVIGAIGAIQIARAIAQPIPRYAEGTENHPGGLAIVGDGGKSETVVLPDGTLYRTPSKDTLIDLPKGSQVIPDYIGRPQNVAVIQPVDNTDKLMAGFASVVYAVKRIPQPIIKADRAWTQAHKIGSSYRNYLNRSI